MTGYAVRCPESTPLLPSVVARMAAASTESTDTVYGIQVPTLPGEMKTMTLFPAPGDLVITQL
jgi:hypothetical protein